VLVLPLIIGQKQSNINS